MTTIRVALIGKTGHGKSSTGNTILREDFFQTIDYTTEGTEILGLKVSRLDNGDIIKVYDTPGNFSLQLTKKQIEQEFERLMEAAGEIDVFILVYRFNTKFTNEEKLAIAELEKCFGDMFLEKHGIVVITYGDLFDLECSFEQWCEKELYALRQKVQNRTLLVCNKGNFDERSKRMTSSKDLLKMITKLKEGKSSYKKEEYMQRKNEEDEKQKQIEKEEIKKKAIQEYKNQEYEKMKRAKEEEKNKRSCKIF